MKININRFIDIEEIEEIGDKIFDQDTGFYYALVKVKKDKRNYMIHFTEAGAIYEEIIELVKLHKEGKILKQWNKNSKKGKKGK